MTELKTSYKHPVNGAAYGAAYRRRIGEFHKSYYKGEVAYRHIVATVVTAVGDATEAETRVTYRIYGERLKQDGTPRKGGSFVETVWVPWDKQPTDFTLLARIERAALEQHHEAAAKLNELLNG